MAGCGHCEFSCEGTSFSSCSEKQTALLLAAVYSYCFYYGQKKKPDIKWDHDFYPCPGGDKKIKAAERMTRQKSLVQDTMTNCCFLLTISALLYHAE